MWKYRIGALIILAASALLGFYVYQSEVRQTKEFQLGLDLSGGVYLTYAADIQNLEPADVRSSLDALRDVIERRINLFGIAESNVVIERATFGGGDDQYRLVVELPGVTDVSEAIEMIGQTPLLEFKVEDPNAKPVQVNTATLEDGTLDLEALLAERQYISTDLTGQFLQRAAVQFDPTSRMPLISLQFNSEGAKLFEAITAQNVGKTVAIYLDGAMLSAPVVQEKITGGQATITGSFTPEEARTMVGRLNSGALPVPINLEATETIGPSLGSGAVQAGVMAGIVGFITLAVFLIALYRLPGVIATIALAFYAVITLAIFKYIPVTLTAAGIAGFIISIGSAVDGNILIFERMKEEIRSGKTLKDAIHVGFDRAWLSIRDSNISSILTAIVLFWFGSSLIKGFALTLGIGVMVSMLSALTVSRVLLIAVSGNSNSAVYRFLFSSGLSK